MTITLLCGIFLQTQIWYKEYLRYNDFIVWLICVLNFKKSALKIKFVLIIIVKKSSTCFLIKSNFVTCSWETERPLLNTKLSQVLNITHSETSWMNLFFCPKSVHFPGERHNESSRAGRADLGLIPDIKMALHKSRTDLDRTGTTAVILAILQAQIIMHFVTKSPQQLRREGDMPA